MIDISLFSPDMIAFGPDILHLVETEIQARKITYKEIAFQVHTASGTVGSWFSRGAIPTDKLWSVVAAVGSAKLWMQVLSRIPGNAFYGQYLDNTDDHPLAALDEAIENAEDFLRWAKEAKGVIRHRKAGYVFQSAEECLLVKMEDSLADYIIIGKMVLVRMEDHYGRSVRDTMNRHSQRMKDRGYCSYAKENAAPARAAN